MGTPDGETTYYSRNVGTSSLSDESDYDLVQKKPKERKVHKSLSPLDSYRNCTDDIINGVIVSFTPVVIISDFTDSRGDDIKIIDQKLPMLIGNINMKNYLPYKPKASFAGVGDAKYDLAPIQVGEYYFDEKIDEVFKHFWREKGGGGTGQESFELMAYFYSYHSILDSLKRGQKGYLFFIGDEGFYPVVSKDEVRRIIGDEIPEDLDAKDVFTDLQEKFKVFFIYPKKPWEIRKPNIDNEIKQRVEKAGGLYEGVDFRASLIWHNTNDLDLHVITPSGFHIYYPSSNKQAPCGGFLDVDMNVRGETTKPVENIRWKKGSAREGVYKVFVRTYAFHGNSQKETPIKVEIEINGEVQSFEKVMPARITGDQSDMQIGEFYYDPSKRISEVKDVYANYQDEVILSQWAEVIPRDNILIIEDPKAIVDVIIGALAIEGGTELDVYIEHMEERGQTVPRRNEVRKALNPLADNSAQLVEIPELPTFTENQEASKTRRL